ncbi:MAG: methyl-accepting chemotaxis protein, partial [Alphaproteobacteria bacterium]|nr:methyl-accepting chemotaxis protein [Alphaproteobacteria bacterium]
MSALHLRISARIFLGFGLILAILIGLILFAETSSQSMMSVQREYMRRTDQSEVLLEAKSFLIETRRAVTLFLLKGGAITEIDAALTLLRGQFSQSRDSFRRQERKDRVSKALTALVDYRKGLDYLVKVREDSVEAAKALEILRAAGQDIQDQITSLTTDLSADMARSAETMKATSEENERILKIVGLCAVLFGVGVAFTIGRGITLPIKGMTFVMGKLAGGDLTVTVPNRDKTDEIGQMARAVEVFKENAIKVEAMRADQAKAEERAAAERKKAMLDMADRFEASVMGVVKNVSAQATEMQATARSMSEIAQQTSSQATAVAAASNEATTNVETVASATEELSASTGEIGSRVTEAARVS